MPETLSQSFESSESSQQQLLSQIQEQFGELNFEEFSDIFSEQDGERQENILQLFQQYSTNSGFLDYIDYEELPYDSDTLEDLINNFPVQVGSGGAQIGTGSVFTENDIDRRKSYQEEIEETEEEIEETEEEIEETIEGKEEIVEGKQRKISELSRYLSGKFNEDIPQDFEGAKNFIEQNFERLLQKSQEQGDKNFVELYKRLETASEAGIINIDLSDFSELYHQAVIRENPSVGKRREEVISRALGVSKIEDVDGTVVRGTGGERIDFDDSSVSLSLEGENGMVLEVGEVQKLDTRNQEVQISRLNREKQDNERKMDTNEKAIGGLETAHSEFRSMPDEAYTNDTFRERIAKKFSSQSPKGEAMEIFRAAETSSGVELKNMVLLFLTKKIVQLSNSNVELSQRNSEITRDIGIFQAQIDSKRRLAAEKIYNKKEKVRQSQQFLEGLGVSRVIANASEIFAMIQPENPISLPNGDIITGVNFATMTFEGSFTPSLGDDGVNDIRTQEVLTQLMNKALTNSFSGPIELTGNGNIVYKLDGKIQDKAVFEAFVNELTGTGNMEMKIQDNLFDSEMIQDEKSMITPE